jgi:Transcriptional regulator
MDKHQLLSTGGLSLDRLQNFCRVAERGSLSKAAEGDLGKQSLYSRQIRELEEFFGVELKRRQGTGFVITDAGRKLAQLTRASLAGLDDFRREAKKIPKRLAIAAGNSVLEWVLLPKIAWLRHALPNTSLQFFSERSDPIVTQLIDMTIDIGLVREDAVRPPLKTIRLFAIGYSLFIPRVLARGILPTNLKSRIADIPIATSVGGQFRESLTQAAAVAKWPLKIVLACSSFTQAARAMRAGDCAAVLPDIAVRDLDNREFAQMSLPFLRGKHRQMCLAWNPRLAEVRPFLLSAVQAIRSATQ